ncbi:succinylglutamate desuccinylase [Stutzerimonas stutzeri]|uniref:Succinylglutamate desuccinylase n=1 Tax=Stutzerimonas stutzeri TaxID=316 RepID=W8R0J4_STUST|nr:succinylglutamate desuccinylase [Stutzerimonas stutzeri]AHL76109.1 succinylglutamate desuccinylase [Stutzerimonas stutzeri]MCQ4330539.1 succinylglutamate desuccinylase [Stutzerimonas stutzeri]
MLTLGRLLELTLAGREPLEKIQFTADGAKLQWLGEGVLEVTPADGQDAGLDLVFSAGVHGCEVVPIELLDRLTQAIGCGEIRPRARLLLLFCNPPAMRQGVRRAGQDLNRLFCGKHANGSTDEARRASQLEALVAGFFREPGRRRWHYDLHSAMRASKLLQFAICPWVADRKVSPESLMRLQYSAVDAVLLQEQSSATFSAHTATCHGAEAFTVELAEAPGSVWPDCLGDFLRAARHWIEATEPVQTKPPRPLMKFRLVREIIKRSEQFVLRLPTDIENFTALPLGTLLAEDEGGVRWVVEEAGAHILFPLADVSIGERAGLIVVPRG